MSVEGTSRAGKCNSEGSGKKSKKGLKRKAHLDAENENAEGMNKVPDYLDEAVLNIKGLDEAPPLKKSKKKKKVLEDVKQQVQGSREKTQDNVQQKSSKQRTHVKFNLESSNMSSYHEKRDSVEEEDPMLVEGTGIIEENELKKPSDTTWVQTASWKSLVGETGRVTFSLGSMLGHNPSKLPGGNIVLNSMGPAQPSLDVQSSHNVSAWIEGSSSAPLFESSSQSNGHSNFSHVKNMSKLIKKSEMQSDSGPSNHQSGKTLGVQGGLERDPQKVEGTKHENAESLDFKQAVRSDHQIGVEKVCRFMRSDNYEQEWLEAKRAVKDIFKRSRKDALRSMKMFHKKHNQ